MENLIFLIFTLLSFININIKGVNTFFEDYMNLDNTNSVKGIFVWMIFFRHCTGYYRIDYRKICFMIDRALQQNIVSLFLFYSGFGINESLKAKGIKYIKTLPIKTLIFFIKSQLILLIFLLNNKILGKTVSLKQYIYAVIFKKGIGNSYWFAFTIMTLYIHSYVSFIFIRKQRFYFIGIIFLTIISYYHVKLVYKYYHPREIISVDTVICFIIGFYYSFFNEYLNKIIMLNDIIYFTLLSIFIYIYYIYYVHQIKIKKSVLYRSIKNMFFSLIIIILTMKIQFKNDFLKFMSSHSYSIYLLQRVTMIFIHQKGYFKNNEFIRFFFELSIVILMACVFDKYTIFIDKLFKRYKNNEKNENNNKISLK